MRDTMRDKGPDMDDTPQAGDPLNLRVLRILVTVLTVTMILGLITVVAVFVTRFPKPGLTGFPETVTLPGGATATAFTVGPDWYGVVTADNRILDQPSDPLRARWQDARTWAECVRIGHVMADEALRIIADATVQQQPALVCRSRDVKLPVESEVIWAVVRNSPLDYPANEDRTVSTRLNLINLGNAQILTIPGEALPNVGFYLKRKMHGEHNLLFGLTNDAFGYIMTKEDFNSFPRYEYISRTSLGEMTGEILIEESLRLVEESPRPSSNTP